MQPWQIVLSIIAFFALTLNSLVIYIFARDWTKEEREFATWLDRIVLNIAISDFLTGLFVFVSLVATDGVIVRNVALCTIETFILNVAVWATWLLLWALSMGRYRAVVKEDRTPDKRVNYCILFAWITGIIAGAAGSQAYAMLTNGQCSGEEDESWRQIFLFIQVAIFLFVSCSFIYFYVRINRAVKRHVKDSFASGRVQSNTYMRLLKFTIWIVICYYLSYIPIIIGVSIETEDFQWFARCTLFGTALVNPLLYFRFMKKYRDIFLQIVSCGKYGGDTSASSEETRKTKKSGAETSNTSPEQLGDVELQDEQEGQSSESEVVQESAAEAV